MKGIFAVLCLCLMVITLPVQAAEGSRSERAKVSLRSMPILIMLNLSERVIPLP